MSAPASEPPQDEPAPWAERDAFEEAILRGDRRRAQALITDLEARGHALVAIDVHLIQAALYHVGERWLLGEISVAQEHLATATARTVMAEAFARAEPAPAVGKRAIFACVQGNLHALGIQMVADAFELAGWEVQCLGADTPMDALVQQVAMEGPDLVGLSVAFPHHLATARETIRQLRAQLGERCPRVLVGGGALVRSPELAAQVGADAMAYDAESALEAAA